MNGRKNDDIEEGLVFEAPQDSHRRSLGAGGGRSAIPSAGLVMSAFGVDVSGHLIGTVIWRRFYVKEKSISDIQFSGEDPTAEGSTVLRREDQDQPLRGSNEFFTSSVPI
jgi:hypothetical protein